MEPMDEDICRKYVGEKPKDVVSCVGDCSGTGWVYGNWGEVCFDFFVIFYHHMGVYSVIMMVVVYVNVQLNVEMQVIYQHHHIIVFRILYLILNDVRRQLVINHDGTLPHGLMYVEYNL
jgi:hypothetical protein